MNNKVINNGEEFYINPEDTAGIIVPEGYSLVVFPGSRAMTRATAENRITHLQYIIYQKDGTGNWIQHLANRKVTQDLSSWPIKAIAISLPINKEYKVVFLGNVDKSVFGSNQTEEILTGTGVGTNYSDARIVLPRVEFTDRNMYYLAKGDFNTNNGTATVDVLLKRIVSRNDITREALQDATGVSSNADYKTPYWKQLIEGSMRKGVFTGEKSAFRYQLGEALKQNIIYPFIFMGLHDASDVESLASIYSAVKKYKEDNYTPGENGSYFTTTGNSFSNWKPAEYANNLYIRYAQFLYDTFVEENSKEPALLEKALEQIYTDNMSYIEESQRYYSITEAVKKAVSAFSVSYTSGVLLPWRNRNNSSYSVVNISSEMPVSVDLDLTPVRYENAGNKCYKINETIGYTADNYISIVTLGDNTIGKQLGITAISSTASGGTTIDFVPATSDEFITTPFTAGSFQRNIKSVTTQKIDNVSLINPQLTMDTENYWQKIAVNFYNVFMNMNPRNENGNQSFLIGNQNSFRIDGIVITPDQLGYMQIKILNKLNGGYSSNEMEYGDWKTFSFPFVTFKIPKLSPDNLNVTTSWTTTTVGQ